MSEVSPVPSVLTVLPLFLSSSPSFSSSRFLQGQKVIFEFFSDGVFVEQLLEFLCLEERKSRDSFNPRRYCLFKVSPAGV